MSHLHTLSHSRVTHQRHKAKQQQKNPSAISSYCCDKWLHINDHTMWFLTSRPPLEIHGWQKGNKSIFLASGSNKTLLMKGLLSDFFQRCRNPPFFQYESYYSSDEHMVQVYRGLCEYLFLPETTWENTCPCFIRGEQLHAREIRRPAQSCTVTKWHGAELDSLPSTGKHGNFFFFLIYFLNWNIVYLQCYTSFRC